MKTKSTILTVAAAAIGLAFIAPDADARPPSKSHGIPSLKQRAERKAQASTATTPKTIGLAAASDTKLRFKRKIGGPAQVLRVKRVARRGDPSAGGHVHPKIGGRQSRTSH